MVKLGNLIMERAEDPLAAMGLSGRQYMVLAVLSSDAPPSQQELAGPLRAAAGADRARDRRARAARLRRTRSAPRPTAAARWSRSPPAGEEILKRPTRWGDRLVAELEPKTARRDRRSPVAFLQYGRLNGA